MRGFLGGFGIAFLAGGVVVGLFLYAPFESLTSKGTALIGLSGEASLPREKTEEERIAEARGKSSKIKALYMTADVANDSGAGATRLRDKIIRVVEETEVNGLVIDVKEVCGQDYNEKAIKRLLGELKEKGVWVIARIVVFKDASQIEAHPEWYLTRKTPKQVGEECFRKRHLREKPILNQLSAAGNQPFWQDKRGGYWFDPASLGAREYILSVSKRMVDFGFDELQFDYIRFPSDGDVEYAQYPIWDKKTPKHFVLKSFFAYLHDNLKEYKPEIVLSADLFGYVAAQREDLTIGQRLEDIGDVFDYVSFMVYPSHYYSGLYVPVDPGRGLPAVNYTFSQARTNPDVVVERSLLAARDFLDGKIATSTQATPTLLEGSPLTEPTPIEVVIDGGAAEGRTRLRPWLEDFFHEEDKAAGRPYGAQKVRMQIDAAERVEDHGWLLWNAANIYTEEALTPSLEKHK